MNRAVFLDRDGVINRLPTDDPEKAVFITKYDEIEYFEDAADSIKRMNSAGFKVIVITNQPAVARGLCTEEGVENLHKMIADDMKNKGAIIDAFYFCPHHPETHHKDIPEHAKKYRIECDCRKPKPGLFLKAAKDISIDLNSSFSIGDRTIDTQAGKNAGCKTILLKTGLAGRDKKYDVEADYECDNLLDAAKVVSMQGIKAIILAGGKGERLWPLTKDIPKPLIKIAGKPLLQHQIEVLRKSGVTEIVLCGSYLVDKIKGYFGSGEKFGVKIYYPGEPKPLGSGGAVKNAKEFLRDTEKFIVINGDKMIGGNFDFAKMLEFDAEKKGFCTLLVRETDHPYDSDILKLDDDGRIVEFVGRGQAGYKTSNSGIVVAKPELLDYIPEGKSNLEKEVIFKLIGKKDIYGFMLPKGWFTRDIGTPERLESVRKIFDSPFSE